MTGEIERRYKEQVRRTAEGAKVLLIDDSEIALQFGQAVLARAGFDVRTASSLLEFDKLLETWSPDIVLTDVHMPEISGADLCKAIKSRLETKRVPVVLFSSLPDDELAKLAKDCGADASLSKMNGTDRLAEQLHRAWEVCFP